MAFSGGTFSRTFDCTTDRDNGVKILASKFDTELDGFATGLSTCILKDGTQTCTAAIPFAEGLTVPDNKTIILGTNSDITIQYDESTNDSLEIAANVEGAALGIVLKADQGDDNADQHKLNIADGGTLTLGSKISGSFVSYLTHTPNSTVASSTTAVAGNLTVGGDLTLGSGAVISEAELEAIDGVTAGTVAASKAVIVDSNKDIASFRNLTLTGELDAGSLDISGDVDVDGTLEADAMTLNGTAITATATLDTGISNNNVPKFTSGVADDDFLRVAGTAIEGRSASEVLSDIGGQASLTFGISNTNAVKIDSSSVADDEYARFTANGLESRATSEVLSDIGAAPAAGSSNIVTTGALNSGSITSGFGTIDTGSSNITTTGVGSFGSLDISGDIDVDGTTNLDAVDIDGAVDMASTLTVSGAFTSPGIDDNADATAITIDSSENVMVGTTNTDPAFNNVAGQSMAASGQFQVTRDGGTAALFNRKSSDGEIVSFRKDSTTVGSIGTSSSRLHINNGDTGLRFAGDLDAIWPCTTDGGDRDNAIDLGSTGIRFKNLYLSGGAYLGGTGSANYLDDYETGNWTPTYDSGYPSGSPEEVVQNATYTKIGNTVIAVARIQARNDATGMQLGGLPFASNSDQACGTIAHDNHTARKERIFDGNSHINWEYSSTSSSLANQYFMIVYTTNS